MSARGVTPLRPYPSHAILRPPNSGMIIKFVDSERNPAQLVSVESRSEAVSARIVHPGKIKLWMSESIRISNKKPIRVVVQDEYGRTGTVFVSTVRQ